VTESVSECETKADHEAGPAKAHRAKEHPMTGLAQSRTTLRWRQALAAGAAITAMALTGCAPGGATPDKGASDTITVGVEAGSPWETYYGKAAAEFTEETGVKVEFQSIPHANMRQQFLSDAVSGAGSYDVYTVDQPWLPEFAQKGYLVPLGNQLSEEDRADFLPHTLDTVTYDDEIYGLPFMVHNTVLYYRTDLLKAAGIDAPPTTWAEYREDAKKLTDPSTGVWGTIIPGKQDGEVATRIETFIKQSGGSIAKADGTPTIDTPEARQALDLMTAIQVEDQSSPPGLHDLTDIQGQFLEGKVAMAFVWPYLYSMASDPAQSKVADKFDIALSPGNPDQVSTTFSWGFGVNSASSNVDAATKWVTWSTSAKILEDLSRSQVTPVPRQSVTDALAADTSLSESQRKAFSVFSESVASSTTIPMTPVYTQYQEALAVAASSVMSNTQTADAALADAQKTAEAAFESMGG
jgi:multiple sugar transport system substrate-binding protein